MISRLDYVISRDTDPYRNIALEKVLTLHAREGECVLFLWRNRRTVVIGRNQNAWEECRVEALARDGGHLARRLSGGGAVYHDLGNLNFSFIARGADHDVARQSETVLRAVRRLGVPAERTGRNDLALEGRKFSGNAFYETKGCHCHHGTVMLDVDTDDMERYLTVSPAKLNSKGVSSVRARVLNLKEVCPDVTAQSLSAALIEEFGEVYGLKAWERSPESVPREEVLREAERLSSEEWLFPPRLPFTVEFSRRFPWGGVRIALLVKQNVIEAAEVFSDAMDERLIRDIRGALPGCRYDAGEIADRVMKAAREGGEGDPGVPARHGAAESVARMIREDLSGAPGPRGA